MLEKNKFQPTDKAPFNKGQKWMIGGLMIAAIVTLFFGTWQFKRSIRAPFERRMSARNTNQTKEKSKTEQLLEMQSKDTDEDGLTDYDEIYIYQTSPYLQDSDSDGIDDKEEIDAGGNPNCPKGQNCGIIGPGSVTPDTSPPKPDVKDIKTDPFGLSNDSANLKKLLNSGAAAGSAANNKNISSSLPDQLPPNQIRELLKQAGMPENIISQFTDEQLLKAYEETLKKVE